MQVMGRDWFGSPNAATDLQIWRLQISEEQLFSKKSAFRKRTQRRRYDSRDGNHRWRFAETEKMCFPHFRNWKKNDFWKSNPHDSKDTSWHHQRRRESRSCRLSILCWFDPDHISKFPVKDIAHTIRKPLMATTIAMRTGVLTKQLWMWTEVFRRFDSTAAKNKQKSINCISFFFKMFEVFLFRKVVAVGKRGSSMPAPTYQLMYWVWVLLLQFGSDLEWESGIVSGIPTNL